MAQVINTNIASLNSQRMLSRSQSAQQTSMERLSSGLRINSAKDDAAGLAISDRMTSQIKGMNQGIRNANDGISLAQTAEGAMQESTNILQRMRELSVQSVNDSNSSSDRSSLQKEVNQLKSELERIATTTSFNGKNLLDGSFASQSFQVGANAGQTIDFSISNSRVSSMGTQTLGGGNNASGSSAPAMEGAVSGDTNGVASGTLVVDGAFGESNISIAAGATSESIAASVNAATDNTGVSATAINNVKLSSVATGNISMDIVGNNTGDGDGVSISANVTNTSDVTALADAINAVSGETGVTAKLNAEKNEIMLTQSSGKDIELTGADASITGVNSTGSFEDSAEMGSEVAIATASGGAVTIGGSVTFNSAKSFDLTGADTVVADAVSNLDAVEGIDISSRSGSTDALQVIDGALAGIDDNRADLGAIQNRFEATISNSENVVQNVSAARSRIQDADFAQESASLAKSGILQQAGMSMLAQANASSQSVLSLLG